MISISLCMIVKNEEDVIGRCLESVGDLFDEIIVVDTGSTDKTKEIVSKYTDKIYDFKWIDDFSAARNYAFSLATKEYCMWLDADDIIIETDREKFQLLKAQATDTINCINMKYNTGFDALGNVTFSYYRERIIKNNLSMKWIGAIHEVIEVFGNREYSDCAITHKKIHPTDPDRNLNIFEKMISNGVKLDPRQQFYYGRELYYHQKYQDAINIFHTFLDEDQGWIENKIDSCLHLSYCYYGLKQDKEALYSLFKSFEYDSPRAEICCGIGGHFFDRQQFNQAIYWYECALMCVKNESTGGFISLDTYNYIPYIQLSVCYSKLDQIDKAIMYNELASEYKPKSNAVINNRAYFKSISTNKQA